MQLPDNSKKYCTRCEMLIKDKTDRLGRTITQAAVDGAKAAGEYTIKAGKKVVKAAGGIAADIKEGAERIALKPKKPKK